MQDWIRSTTHRKLFVIFFVCCFLILWCSYYDTTAFSKYQTLFTGSFYNITDVSDTHFLVSSSKCKMVNLDPFNSDAQKFFRPEPYESCRKHELLTYLTKTDNTITLHVDTEAIPSYTSKGVRCCYSNVTRATPAKNPDGTISVSNCQWFNESITLHHDVVMVKCLENRTTKKIYENVHVGITITKEVREKIDNFDNTTNPISVLFIGIDSVSRLNFIRALPNTYRYVEDNGWLTLKGYNKMDDNTFPNLMAILTGYNQTQARALWPPEIIGKLDTSPLLWYDFKKLGYVTGYAEDEASINTFNYRKKGFLNPPADYYFRPYTIATEKLDIVRRNSMSYCTGPETSGERIMNLAEEFAVTFKDHPHFGFFWMNTFSHNTLNSVSGMDNKTKQFLVNLEQAGIYNKSLVIFLSDHGMRFGPIRLTETGWLEERLPFIYVSFPPWFKENFPKEYENFKNNANKLTTPYDVHMTLKHILVLSGFNYSMTPSDACPKCRSLFEQIEYERSCEDAALEQHWCTCSGYTEIKLDKDLQEKLSKHILDNIYAIYSNSSRGGGPQCANFTIGSILSTSLSQKFISYKDSNYLLVKLETVPKAVFETTLIFQGDLNNTRFSLSGDVSRLDYYSDHSQCVNDAYLKKYCYCI